MALVTENQLDEWVRAHAREAQGTIVELIWRLVAASCPRPRDRRFPLSDSIGQHGPDGILDTPVGFEPFAPEGKSYWEIGTGGGAGDKATSDYKDLTAAVPEALRRDAGFIFVTPLSGRRDWEHTWKEDAQGRWQEERRTRNDWKDVRVIDGTRIIDWLHQCPAVEFWLAAKMGLSTEQVQILDECWGLLQSMGEPPPLKPQVFLVNRDEACARLKDVLDDKIGQLKLATHFPDQITDFVAAYVASLADEVRIEALSRCLIVSGSEAWNSICTLKSKHVLIADVKLDLNGDSGTKLIQKARRAGHAVVFGGPKGGIPDPTNVDLPSPRAHQIRDALATAGYNEERARILAQKSNGNLGTLLRCLQNLSVLPAWAERGDAAELAIATFVGSWVEGSDADRAAIGALAGKAYGEWIGKIREIAAGPNTPLAHYEGNWKFVTRYEGWYVLGPRIFDEHLDKFREVATSVLKEKDPQFDLPPEERFAAPVHGKVLVHSKLLRQGLAETIALLGSHPDALVSCTGSKAAATAAVVVRDLLSDTGWARWAALNDLLPLFAEAAPNEFLAAVENALAANPRPFDELFAQEGRGLVGRNYMTGLFWGLETLAWEPTQLSRVALCLAGLAGHDPGGQWVNRPLNSLTTILLPWLPQTCATVPKRIAGVKAVLTEAPSIGWKLLLNLLPTRHGVSHGSRRPEWRSMIPEGWSQTVPPDDYLQQVSAYADLAIEEARRDLSRLAELCERLEELPQPAYERILEYLSSDAVANLSEQDRLPVWSKVDGLAKQHKRFADADWAMPPSEVQRLEAVANRIAPRVPFYRHQKLFTERWMELLEEKDNFEQQAIEIERRRDVAVEEILAAGGVQGALEFAKAVEAPWRVGAALGSVAPDSADEIILPSLLETNEKALVQSAGGFVRGRLQKFGWKWVDEVTTSTKWTPSQYGQLLSFLPFTLETWRRASRLLGEDQSAYWSKTPANHYEVRADYEVAIENLLRYKRPRAAVRCLHRILDDKKKLDTSLAARVLLAAVASDEPRHQLDSYETVEIIKALQLDASTNRDDLYRVEWAYLPWLDKHSGASPITLERRLADEPASFCEAIRLIFRSKKEDRQKDEEVTDLRKAIAGNAYQLLQEWSIPPGLREDGAYDGAALNSWLQTVKGQCAETGHLEVAMTMVGHVLVHVPPDPDGLWIHRAAAAALNASDADKMRSGFTSQIFNSRGVHWVDPTGKPERDLAEKYRLQAEALDTAGFPRLAASIRGVAESYVREAQRVSAKHEFDD